MLKLCSELHATGGRNKSSSPDKRSGRTASKTVSHVKTSKGKRTPPRLFTPYEMARLLSASVQGFVFRDYLICDLDLTRKKGVKGM
jgi:hypothetical protein